MAQVGYFTGSVWNYLPEFCSYRFIDLFNEPDLVRDMQKELDQIIQQGVVHLTRLLKNSETGISSGTSKANDEEFDINTKKQNYLRS